MAGRKVTGNAADVGGVPPLRLYVEHDRPPSAEGAYVVYWMSAARRTHWNFAMDRAVGWARELKRPLLVVEVLACGGRWDSDRQHRFVLQGMQQNSARLACTPALYYPYVESRSGECRTLFRAIAEQACVVVTDHFPIASPSRPTIAESSPMRVETVDGNGLLPMRAAGQAFPTAYAFRRFLQRALPEHLLDAPQRDPLANAALPRLRRLPAPLGRRWPAASARLLSGDAAALARLPIDHGVPPVLSMVGGPAAAHACWTAFLTKRLDRYSELRNQPEADATSGLAPNLHFGHISSHEVFRDVAQRQGWSPAALAEKATGSREGWWGMSDSAEAFLDQLVTWRELGFNFCTHRSDCDEYESLPPWARATLAKHAGDIRPHVYSLEEFAAAKTHDPLWNAAQRQLLAEGRIHNYLRMLWGKKILEWTADPREALDVMIELNNRYALDGQDPNSYSGIFWVLGRYDRPWGPERPIFGKVRYMSSESTARKVRVGQYMQHYADRSIEQIRGAP